MTNHTIRLALAAAIAICFASPLTAQRYSFQDLDIPDVVELSAYDINNDNVVVGTLVEIFDGEEFEDGFVWDDGEFFFPFVDVFLPSFNGINDLGTIVGVGIDVDEFSFASFFAEGEEVTLFGFPGPLSRSRMVSTTRGRLSVNLQEILMRKIFGRFIVKRAGKSRS